MSVTYSRQGNKIIAHQENDWEVKIQDLQDEKTVMQSVIDQCQKMITEINVILETE